MARGLRLGWDLEVLDEWTDTASDADVDAVTNALFALVERTVYRDYPVIGDSAIARELVVVVRDDLAMRVRLHGVDKFAVLFIGSTAAALELHRADESPADAS